MFGEKKIWLLHKHRGTWKRKIFLTLRMKRFVFVNIDVVIR